MEASFAINALIVINDTTTEEELHRGSSAHEVGSFKIQLSNDWIDSLIDYSGKNSRTFEKFQQSFHKDGPEIEGDAYEVLEHPSFDKHDGLAEVKAIHAWNLCDELTELCNLTGETENCILGILFEYDGFIIDRVYEPTEVVTSCMELRSGDIDSEEFEDMLSELNLEFEVECHMLFNAILDAECLESEFSSIIKTENEDRVSILCKSIVKKISDPQSKES